MSEYLGQGFTRRAGGMCWRLRDTCRNLEPLKTRAHLQGGERLLSVTIPLALDESFDMRHRLITA